jgi:hypothetical protein
MAGRQYAPFIGPSEPTLDRKTSVQRAINLYVSPVHGGGEDKQFVLKSAPGVLAFAGFKDKNLTIRGIYVARGELYIAAGQYLYKYPGLPTASYPAPSGNPYIGFLQSSDGFVSMKEARDQLIIVDGENGYFYNFDDRLFGQITDPDWRGSVWAEEMDGYAIFVAPDTDQFYISDLDNVGDLNALDFSSADSAPDKLVTHRVRSGELLLFGRNSIEIWVNSAGVDFPFSRYGAAYIDVGCVGYRAVINAADTIYWVGERRGTPSVFELNGHQPVPISTMAVEQALAACDALEDINLWTYKVAGHEFIGMLVPGSNTTWVYDAVTRKWHERCELVDGEYVAWPAEQYFYFQGKNYLAFGNALYEVTEDNAQGLRGHLLRERTWPHMLAPSFEPVAYRGLELQMSTGTVKPDEAFDPSREASVILEISNDGGYTWGAPLYKNLGATGRWMETIRWLMLGSAKDRVFRVRVTDNVPVTFHRAVIDA